MRKLLRSSKLHLADAQFEMRGRLYAGKIEPGASPGRDRHAVLFWSFASPNDDFCLLVMKEEDVRKSSYS